MKHYISILLFFAVSIIASAQGDHWSLSHDNEGAYGNTPVYARLNLGTSLDIDYSNYEIAAFIDGEVRASTRGNDDVNPASAISTDYNYFVLNVQGNYDKDAKADEGKTITFRMYNLATGIEYTLKSSISITFGAEKSYGSVGNLVELSAIEVTSISLKDIEMIVGNSVDLTTYLTLTPSNATMPDNVEWSVGSYTKELTLKGSQLTANEEGTFQVSVMIGQFSGTTTPLTATANVTVTVPTVKATAIKIKDGYNPITVRKGNAEYLNFMLSAAYELEPFDAEDVVTWVVTGAEGIVTPTPTGEWYPAEKGETKMQAQIKESDGTVRLKSEEITVKVIVDVEELTAALTPSPLVLGIDGVLTVKANDGATITPASLTVSEEADDKGQTWSMLKTGTPTAKSDGTVTIAVTPLYPGSGKLTVTYDGSVSTAPIAFEVGVPLTMKSGWQWMKVWSYIDEDQFAAAFGKNVEEVRSQSALLAYDATYGFYGDLTPSPYDGLKLKAAAEVKAANAYVMTGGHACLFGSEAELNKSWTWVPYPYVHSFDLSALNLSASNGDRIVSKENGFAEYSGGKWTGSLTTLKPFESYLYYNNLDKTAILEWPTESSLLTSASRASLPTAEVSVPQLGSAGWEYDASRFSDNMSIVARLSPLPSHPQYTVGAFVGNECRGEGVFVDGLLFITVHANMGEKVSFRIKDSLTDSEEAIAETMTVSRLAGSVSSPVSLTMSSWASGIEVIPNSEFRIPDSVYDLNGRRVKEFGIRNSHLKKGIVIRRDANGSVRKVMK